MKVLVCGGRAYGNEPHEETVIFHWLSEIHFRHPITAIIHGDAPGADAKAKEWATQNHVECQAFRADWNTEGRRAGPIRNQRMLDIGKPDLVIAFPGGKGTADMVERAKRAKLSIVVFTITDGHMSVEAINGQK